MVTSCGVLSVAADVRVLEDRTSRPINFAEAILGRGFEPRLKAKQKAPLPVGLFLWLSVVDEVITVIRADYRLAC